MLLCKRVKTFNKPAKQIPISTFFCDFNLIFHSLFYFKVENSWKWHSKTWFCLLIWYWLNLCCFGRQECGCLHTSKGRKWSTQKTGEHEPHPVAARYCMELRTLVHSSAHWGKMGNLYKKNSHIWKKIIIL